MKARAIEKTDFPGLVPFEGLKFYSREKIWDAWDLSPDRFLLVATDRIWLNGSLAGAIPGKGKCIVELMLFWADFFKKIIGTFVLSSDLSYACSHSVWLESWNNDLEGRSLVIRRVPIMPLRWIVGKDQKGECQVLSVGAKNGQEPVLKSELILLEKWIKKNKIRDKGTCQAPDPKLLKRRMDSLACCLFRKANAHAVARKMALCCSAMSFGWFGGAPVLAGDFFTPNSSSLSLIENRGEQPDDAVRSWLANKKWSLESLVPRASDQVLKKATDGYQKIITRIRS